MSKLNQIDQQIETLKLKKKHLQQKQAETFLKAVLKIWGEEFDETLALGILAQSKKEAEKNPNLKEAWREAAAPFQKRSPKTKKAA